MGIDATLVAGITPALVPNLVTEWATCANNLYYGLSLTNNHKH